MRRNVVILVIVAILVSVGLSGCSSPGQSIVVHKLSGGYGNSVTMNEQQMNNFPHLMEAKLMNKTVIVESPSQEMDKLRGVFDYFDPQDIFPNIIFYQNEYYEIAIKYVD